MRYKVFSSLFLCSRFVLNVPKEDLQSFERILFLVEYAHWFYEDNSVEKNPSLKSLNLKEFTSLSILCSIFFDRLTVDYFFPNTWWLDHLRFVFDLYLFWALAS